MHSIKALSTIVVITCLFGCEGLRNQVIFIKHKEHIDFIRSNPDKTESAHTLIVMATTFGKSKTEELYNLLSDSVKNSDDGKLVIRYIELFENPQIGERFIDFEMNTPDGQIKRLSDYAGKIVLLEFWASWCKGSMYQMPHLSNTYEKFHESGFEIFAVSYDQELASWEAIIERGKMNWHHVSELKSVGNTAGLIYGVTGIPDNFLIDENGTIIARDLRGDNLDKKLAKLLQKRNASR